MLCRRKRDWRRCSQTLREFKSCALKILGCYNLIHDPESHCFLSIDRLTEKEHLTRFIRRHEARQKIRSTPVRMQPDFRKRLAKRGISRCDTQITCKREIAARTRCWTIDRRD